MLKIIIAAESKRMREKLAACFTEENMEIIEAEDGAEALVLVSAHKPQLVVMVGELPVLTTLDLCQQIRKLSEVPLLLVVDRTATELGIMGLELGADAFTTLPVNTREVRARVQAIWRRCGNVLEVPEHIHYTDLEIDYPARQVIAFGQEVTLTHKEFELLWLLAVHANKPYTRAQLLQDIWGKTHLSDMRTVDTHVKKLRQKLNASPECSWHIATVWSVGYKFEVADNVEFKRIYD